MKLEELQDRLFDVLCIVDDICEKENVRYFIDSGTELGAIRERDFIPWDDDLDIKVMAEDYPAFKAVMEKNLPEHLHLIEPDVFAPGFHDFVVHIYDDRWLLREETEEDRFYHNYQNRVGTDVFIISSVPNFPLGLLFARCKIRILYGLGMAHRYSIDYGKYTGLQRTGVFILSKLGKITSMEWLWKQVVKNFTAWSRHSSDWKLRVNCPYLRTDKAVWFKSAVKEGEIRGRRFPVPIGYAEELARFYGEDFMVPRRDPQKFNQHLDEKDRYGNRDI